MPYSTSPLKSNCDSLLTVEPNCKIAVQIVCNLGLHQCMICIIPLMNLVLKQHRRHVQTAIGRCNSFLNPPQRFSLSRKESCHFGPTVTNLPLCIPMASRYAGALLKSLSRNAGEEGTGRNFGKCHLKASFFLFLSQSVGQCTAYTVNRWYVLNVFKSERKKTEEAVGCFNFHKLKVKDSKELYEV